MSAIPQLQSALPHPERIVKAMRRVATRRWLMQTVKGLLQTMLVSLTIFLTVVLALGTFANMPAWLRVALPIGAWCALAACALCFLRHSFIRDSLSQAAQQVEAMRPELQERISSAVELANQSDPRFAGSPELIAHLMRQAEADVQGVDPKTVISSKTVQRYALFVAPIVLAWAVLTPMMPRPMLAGLANLFHPFTRSVAVRYSPVIVTPGDIILPQGDPLEISVRLPEEGKTPDPNTHASMISRYEAGQSLTTDMPRTSVRAFHTFLDNVQQNFDYRILTPAGDSPWYHVSVQPRPAIAGIDLNYTYPKYTGLKSKTDLAKDGSIDAIVGTQVQLTIHSTQLLASNSHLLIAENTPEQQNIPLMSSGGTDYQAVLTVKKAGQYRIQLVNQSGLTNKDNQLRTITARPDAPPTVAITAPPPLPVDTVARLEDTVPIAFTAADDFGIAKLQAIVQIDGQPAETFDVKLRHADQRELKSKWDLDIPYQLAKKNLKDGNTITYQLQVMDNRDSDRGGPQSGMSAKQTIRIDHSMQQSYASRSDAAVIKSLGDAIRKALERTNQAEAGIAPLRQGDQNRIFAANEKLLATTNKDALALTSKELSDVAEQNLTTSFGVLAKAAKEIAEHPILDAADALAKVAMNAEVPDRRGKPLATAAEQIAEAKKQLQQLLGQLEIDARRQDAARTVAELAGKQDKVATAMDEAAQKAADYVKQLEDALKKQQQDSTQLQKDLAKKQEELQKEQQVLALKQAAQPPAPEEVTKKQQEIALAQKEIQQLQQEMQKEQQETAKIQQDSQVKNQAVAVEQQKNVQEQVMLRQKLEELVGRDPELQKPEAVQTALKLAQLIAKTEQLQTSQKALEVQTDKQEAVADAGKKAEEIAKKQQELNKEIADFAQDNQNALKNANIQPPQKPQMDQAVAALQQKQSPQAAELQKQIAQQLAQDAQAADAQANKPDAATPPQVQAEQALAKAKEIDKQQEQLADEIKKADDAKQPPTKPTDAPNQKAMALAEQVKQQAAALNPNSPEEKKALDEAKKDAAKAQEAAKKGDAAEASKAVAEAADKLQEAEQKQIEQAKFEANHAKEQAAEAAKDAAQLAERQKQLADESAQAAKELAEAQQNMMPPAQAEQSQQQLAELTKQAASEAKQLQDQAQKEAPQVAERAKEAQKALEEAARHQQEAVADEHKNAPAEAGKDQAKAQEKLAEAERDLRNLPEEPKLALADKNAQQTGHDPMKTGEAAVPAQAAKADPADAAKQAADAGEKGHQGEAGKGEKSPPATPAEALKQAAQQVQEARQAEQEAVAAKPEAAKEAAQALDDAAQALADNSPEQQAKDMNDAKDSQEANADPSQDDSKNPDAAKNDEPGNEKGKEPGKGSNKGSKYNRNNKGVATSHKGVDIREIGNQDARPAAVQEIGISASDWTKLSPLMQQQLLNAAQQSGPPSYREMIKNYYVRIARLQAEEKPEARQ